MDTPDPGETLRYVDAVRRRARTSLRSFWFPLVVFGALMLLSAPIPLVLGGPAAGAYWAVAGPAGGIATGVYYYRRERRTGLEGPWVPYVLTGIGILAGSFFVATLGVALGATGLAAVGPTMVVATGILVFAVLDRSVALAAVGIALAAVATWLWSAGVRHEVAEAALAAISGGIFLVAGLAFAAWERARQ